MSKRIMTVVFAVLSSGMWVGVVNGALINVQFGSAGVSNPYSGGAVVGTSGDYWNPITANGTNNPLNSSVNVSAGVSLDLNSLGVGDIDGLGGPFDAPNQYRNLFRGLTAAQPFGTPITITLNGVTPGAYNLYLIGAPNHPDVQDRNLTVTAMGDGTVGPLTIGPNNFATTLQPGTNWVVLHPVVGVSGVLTISGAWGGGGNEGNLSGFQLQVVPEPTTVGMLLCGSVAMLRFVRRRTR